MLVNAILLNVMSAKKDHAGEQMHYFKVVGSKLPVFVRAQSIAQHSTENQSRQSKSRQCISKTKQAQGKAKQKQSHGHGKQ